MTGFFLQNRDALFPFPPVPLFFSSGDLCVSERGRYFSIFDCEDPIQLSFT